MKTKQLIRKISDMNFVAVAIVSASAFYSIKLCVMINFSLRHNVLCFSFVVVLYSMYSLYAIIKVVLLNEKDCHV